MLLLTAREVRLWRNPTPAPELAAFGRPTAMPRGSSRRCAPPTLSAKPMTTKSAIMRASQLGANTRKGTKVLWIKYRDRTGHISRESANTEDWQEAQKRLRARLQARDERVLEIVRKGEQQLFGEWTEFFL